MLCDVPNRPPDCCCVVVVAVFPPPKRDIFVGQRVCAQSSRDEARSLRNLGERVARFIQTRGHQSKIQATAAVIVNAAFIYLGKLRTRLALSLSRDAVHDRRPPARPWQMRPSFELNLRTTAVTGSSTSTHTWLRVAPVPSTLVISTLLSTHIQYRHHVATRSKVRSSF